MIKFLGFFVILTVTSEQPIDDHGNEVELERSKRQSDMYYQQPQMYDDNQYYGPGAMSTIDEYGNRKTTQPKCIACVLVEEIIKLTSSKGGSKEKSKTTKNRNMNDYSSSYNAYDSYRNNYGSNVPNYDSSYNGYGDRIRQVNILKLI